MLFSHTKKKATKKKGEEKKTFLPFLCMHVWKFSTVPFVILFAIKDNITFYLRIMVKSFSFFLCCLKCHILLSKMSLTMKKKKEKKKREKLKCFSVRLFRFFFSLHTKKNINFYIHKYGFLTYFSLCQRAIFLFWRRRNKKGKENYEGKKMKCWKVFFFLKCISIVRNKKKMWSPSKNRKNFFSFIISFSSPPHSLPYNNIRFFLLLFSFCVLVVMRWERREKKTFSINFLIRFYFFLLSFFVFLYSFYFLRILIHLLVSSCRPLCRIIRKK